MVEEVNFCIKKNHDKFEIQFLLKYDVKSLKINAETTPHTWLKLLTIDIYIYFWTDETVHQPSAGQKKGYLLLRKTSRDWDIRGEEVKIYENVLEFSPAPGGATLAPRRNYVRE